MKRFSKIVFDRTACLAQLREFKKLLDSQQELEELRHFKRFFETHEQLCALIGFYNTHNLRKNAIAHQLELFGDFACDLAVGDSSSKAYCLIEFEDAKSNSIFVETKRHHHRWSRRFDEGFGQLIDWMWCVTDERQTDKFRDLFGDTDANILPMLVIGRSAFLDNPLRKRLTWRNRNVQLIGAPAVCLTYDELYEGLKFKLEDVMPLTSTNVDAAMEKVSTEAIES